MKALKQVWAVTALSLQSIPQRLGTSSVIVVGIGGVVAVMVSMLAMATGLIETMQNAGRDDRVIVLRNGSTSETGSALAREAMILAGNAAGLKRDSHGAPLLSAEASMLINLYRKEDGAEVNAIIRGVGAKAAEVRPELRIVEGRTFRPSVPELIVGRAAKRQYRQLELGDQLRAYGVTWTIVGTFESAGDSHESELIGDVETAMLASQRTHFQSITAVLDSPASFEAFKADMTANPALAVDVLRELDYFETQSQRVSQLLFIVAYVVGGIMGCGAIAAALNTMYSAVGTRAREIATLRAIGFGSVAMVISVLIEALLLASLGGVVGALLAWLFFHGHTVSTGAGGPVFGQLIFDMTVSPRLAFVGIGWALLIGLLGALMPAARAARLPVAEALRTL